MASLLLESNCEVCCVATDEPCCLQLCGEDARRCCFTLLTEPFMSDSLLCNYIFPPQRSPFPQEVRCAVKPNAQSKAVNSIAADLEAGI